MRHETFSQAYIGGEWLDGGQTFPVKNPATGEVIAEVANLTPQDAERAIATAAAAFPAWAAKTPHERGAIMRRWAEFMLRDQEELARLLTAEKGKPLAEARGEIANGASYFDWFSEEAKRGYGEVIPTNHAGKRYLTIRQPAGVAVAITPWNFPNAMLARKASAALAVGCTMVAKPAAETPLSAVAMARLGEEAGVPPGVFNVVTSTDARGIGRVFCESPKVRVLSFTGSTEVGKILYSQSAGTLKKLALELGGNAPLIVFDDADLDKAVDAAMTSKFRNAGQTCVCANRLYVQSGIYNAFAAKFIERVRALKVGPGDQDGVQIGPLINQEGVDKVTHLIEDAVSKGAKVLAGGGGARGLFFEPTVLGEVVPPMEVLQIEAFGPLAPLTRFDTEAQSIAMANDTKYGLAAYVFTRDVGRTFRVAEALEYGIVSVNEGLPSVAVAPFGGVKESGIGREGGRQGLEEYMETKYICLGVA